MDIHDMLSDMQIDALITLVQNHEEQVESRHDRCTHRHIRSKAHLPVVPPTNRVGRGEDRSSRVESGLDTCFRDGDGLLFHRLVNGDLIRDIHFVEFIDGADPVVREHQCTRFDSEFARFFVLHDRGCQTGGRRSFARRVNRSRQEATDIPTEYQLGTDRTRIYLLQKLGFACTRIPNDADVQVTTQMDTLLSLLVHPAHELKKDTFLDDLMTC